MKYFSTFSGIGGFELGIQLAYDNRPNVRNGTESLQENMSNAQESSDRPTCVGYSEIDKYASAIYQHHYPDHKNYGNITKIVAEALPDFECLVGGFPCQAFSIAGKRKGFDDTRGTLFFDLARILRAKQPRLFVFENVKGLLSHDNGNTFKTIIATIDELGYDCQWQVLNSKNHGVPQNRERVFIVGHLRGTPRPKVFPFGETNGEATDIVQLNQPKHSNDRVYAPEGLSPTLNTMQGGNRQPFIVAERGRYNENGKTEQKMESRHDGLTNTLTSVEKDNRVHDGLKIRRLTPTECERLQGFPDGWTDVVNTSDTQRYKTLGNAVTVNVIRDIFEKIIV
jgi:DNA (cytosine-5)-methyltransferase 1